MKIKAFGKVVSRKRAYDIIIGDKISEICDANMSDSLEWILMYGWKSLEEWTDKELEEYLSELLIENQPVRSI